MFLSTRRPIRLTRRPKRTSTRRVTVAPRVRPTTRYTPVRRAVSDYENLYVAPQTDDAQQSTPFYTVESDEVDESGYSDDMLGRKIWKKKGFKRFTKLVKKIAPVAAVGAGLYFGVPLLTAAMAQRGVSVKPSIPSNGEGFVMTDPAITTAGADAVYRTLEKQGIKATSPEARAIVQQSVIDEQQKISGGGSLTPIVIMGLISTGAFIYFMRKR